MKKTILILSFTLLGMVAVYFAIEKIKDHQRYGNLTGAEAAKLRKQDNEARQREKCFTEEGYHKVLAEKYIIPKLLDPSSFMHVLTDVTDADDEGNYVVIMEYRAKNSFGGYVAGWVEAELDLKDCNSVVIRNEKK